MKSKPLTGSEAELLLQDMVTLAGLRERLLRDRQSPIPRHTLWLECSIAGLEERIYGKKL
jgi:hypothetical protein